jgi:hypothetical protein
MLAVQGAPFIYASDCAKLFLLEVIRNIEGTYEMLSILLPQRNGDRVQIPSGDYEMKRLLEACSFFPEYDDRRALVMRRIGPDDALREAQACRMGISRSLATRMFSELRRLSS